MWNLFEAAVFASGIRDAEPWHHSLCFCSVACQLATCTFLIEQRSAWKSWLLRPVFFRIIFIRSALFPWHVPKRMKVCSPLYMKIHSMPSNKAIRAMFAVWLRRLHTLELYKSWVFFSLGLSYFQFFAVSVSKTTRSTFAKKPERKETCTSIPHLQTFPGVRSWNQHLDLTIHLTCYSATERFRLNKYGVKKIPPIPVWWVFSQDKQGSHQTMEWCTGRETSKKHALAGSMKNTCCISASNSRFTVTQLFLTRFATSISAFVPLPSKSKNFVLCYQLEKNDLTQRVRKNHCLGSRQNNTCRPTKAKNSPVREVTAKVKIVQAALILWFISPPGCKRSSFPFVNRITWNAGEEHRIGFIKFVHRYISWRQIQINVQCISGGMKPGLNLRLVQRRMTSMQEPEPAEITKINDISIIYFISCSSRICTVVKVVVRL